MVNKHLQLRRGNKIDLPNLLEGEPGYSLDTKEFHIGNATGDPSLFLSTQGTTNLINQTVGDKSLLKTNAKSNIVGAINELHDASIPVSNANFITKRAFKSYIASEPTTLIPIEGASPGDFVDILIEGLTLIENVDYIINREYTSATLLNYELAKGDIAYYVIYQTKPNVFIKAAFKGSLTTPIATNTLTIPNVVADHYCRLYYQGLTLEEALGPNDPRQYSITPTGVVTFTFDLQPGDYVYYEVFKRSYDFHDLSNIPEGVEGYTLPAATTNLLGGVKVGSGLSMRGEHLDVDLRNIQDNYLELNNSETGEGITRGVGGLKVKRGTLPAQQIAFNESIKKWCTGEDDLLKPIATEEHVTSALRLKANTSDLPTTVSQLTNDIGYFTKTQLDTEMGILEQKINVPDKKIDNSLKIGNPIVVGKFKDSLFMGNGLCVSKYSYQSFPNATLQNTITVYSSLESFVVGEKLLVQSFFEDPTSESGISSIDNEVTVNVVIPSERTIEITLSQSDFQKINIANLALFYVTKINSLLADSMVSSNTFKFQANEGNANGVYSTSINSSFATSDYSFSAGKGIASGYCQTAIGMYNKQYFNLTSKVDTDVAFVVGNGTSNLTENRSNALSLTWEGILDVAKDIQVNGNSVTSQISILSKKVDDLVYISNAIYGVEVDYNNSTVTRVRDSVGLTQASFDNIAPWKDMKRITKADGNIMVEIPNFYYKTEIIASEKNPNGDLGVQTLKARYLISPTPQFGFKAMFNYADGIRNKIEFSAYEGSLEGDKLVSKPNAKVLANKTRAESRILARANGVGYQQQDFISSCAIQWLMLVEYASFDTQSMIGRGNADDSWDGTDTGLNTGLTVSLGNKSGNATGTDGRISVSYRGIENFWGNYWKWVDGINIEAKDLNIFWYTNDVTKYADETKTGFIGGFNVAKTNGCANAIGYNTDADFGFIATRTSGASNKALNDNFYQNYTHDGFLLARLGGAWYLGSSTGGFCWSLSNLSSFRAVNVASRLLRI